MKVAVCGGGTGGHIYPALAVIEALRLRGLTNEQILWIGTHGQMEETLVPRAGLQLQTVSGGPIAGVPRLTQLRNAAKLAGAIVSARKLLQNFKPNALFLTGGYVNAPVALAAKSLGIQSAIYLPDVEPGSAIKRIAPLATKIACTTGGSAEFLPKEKLVVTGYPVRAQLREALDMTPAEARKTFALDAELPTLFVFGGSRGAQTINQAMMQILPTLLQTMQVIHVTGSATWDEVAAFAEGLDAESRVRYRPKSYLHEEMATAFRAADLIVARAGASMLGESPAFGVPAILVPYPYAWRYQKVNADYLAERGAGVRLDDKAMGERLLPTILNILHDAVRLEQMKAAAQRLDTPNAAAEIADVLLSLNSSK